MARQTTSTKKKATISKQQARSKQAVADETTAEVAPRGVIAKTKRQIELFLARRPHRSFRLTRRRDYARSLKLPGYIAFTREVFSVLAERRTMYILLALLYAVATALFIGIGSQATYNELSDTLQETSENILEGAWGEIGKASLVFATSVNGGLYDELTELQQSFVVLLFVLLWLTTVWLLRAQLAGRNVRLRDGLYSAGAPIVPMVALVFFFIVQLMPATLAFIAYSAGVSSGFLAGGVESFLFFVVAGLLVLLTLYLTTTTFFSLIVVTLPGMYPWQAIRVAGDLVVGRRLRLLLRLVWVGVFGLLVWAIILIPIILLTSWVQSFAPVIKSVPIVPLALLVLSSASAVYIAAYIYLLYRKVVEDDAKPA